jgi:biotin operon repressor
MSKYTKDFRKPTDSENEAFIIGACLLDQASFPVAAEIIRGPADFEDLLAQATWAAMRAVYAEQGEVSYESVEQELRRRQDLEKFWNTPEEITAGLRRLRDGYGPECEGVPAALRRRCSIQRERAARWGAAEKIGPVAYDMSRPLEQIIGEEVNALSRLAAEAAPVTARTRPQTSFTWRQLASAEIAPISFAVDNFLPEGLTLLGGRPKQGKTVLAFQLAGEVGGAPEDGGSFLGARPARGRVLYLALEDPARRVQDRAHKQGWPDDADVDIETTWPIFSEGGFAKLAKRLLETHYVLCIIDTLNRFLGRADFLNYGAMGADLAELQRLALDRKTAILVLTHTNKVETGDIGADILGSTAITGAADGYMLLRRRKGGTGEQWELAVADGRDVGGNTFQIVRNAERLTWELAEGEAGIKQGSVRAQVLDAFDRAGGRAAGAKIADDLGKPRQNVHNEIKALEKAGLVAPDGGGYYRRIYDRDPSE